jgi:hypothetical protein
MRVVTLGANALPAPGSRGRVMAGAGPPAHGARAHHQPLPPALGWRWWPPTANHPSPALARAALCRALMGLPPATCGHCEPALSGWYSMETVL